MKTFLVPVDFSAVSGEIIATAISLARPLKGKVALLHVVQPPIMTSEYPLAMEAVQETTEVRENAAAARLAVFAEKFRAAGLAVEPLVRLGPPVSTILEEADKVHADFIIMGSRGHGRLYDLLIGSTASGVLKAARCGVLIMPPQAKAA